MGYERALVDAVPGTTRDVVKKLIAVDGWPIVLGDSAGFHDTCQAVDRAAMARPAAALQQADLVLWVVDLSGPWIGPERLFTTAFSAASGKKSVGGFSWCTIRRTGWQRWIGRFAYGGGRLA